MFQIILAFLSMLFFLIKYIRTRYLRNLWATAFCLFLTGLKVYHAFFVPVEVFGSSLGWLKYPFAIFLVLSGLSLFWVCFAPIKQQDEPKRARRWRSSIH
jgi:hypothetical protein